MTTDTTPTKKITNRTYEDVKAEQEAILKEFVSELKRLDGAGMSLRQIGKMKKLSHETVRKLLQKDK